MKTCLICGYGWIKEDEKECPICHAPESKFSGSAALSESSSDDLDYSLKEPEGFTKDGYFWLCTGGGCM